MYVSAIELNNHNGVSGYASRLFLILAVYLLGDTSSSQSQLESGQGDFDLVFPGGHSIQAHLDQVAGLEAQGSGCGEGNISCQIRQLSPGRLKLKIRF